jgi:putative Mn2+ efflux pump MntP
MGLFIQLIVLSFSLALDAVSVSVAGGVEVKQAKLKHAVRIAFFFGLFQAVMPLLGWEVGNRITFAVSSYAPWIAFILLTSIGVIMIREAQEEKKEKNKSILSYKTLLLLAFATSIDAFVVGISLGLIKIPLLLAVSVIGVITFLLCIPAFLFGSHLNRYFEGKLELLGGVALILIGLKILLSALF